LINGAPISWQSQRQPTIATSSTQAEYMAANSAAKEAIYLRQLLKDLGHEQTTPTVIHKDNQGTIDISENPVKHKRTKHFDVQFHFIREQVELKIVQLQKIPSKENIADMLTKALPQASFRGLLQRLNF